MVKPNQQMYAVTGILHNRSFYAILWYTFSQFKTETTKNAC